MTLTKEQEYVVMAALTSMTKEIHSIQDHLTDDQWKLAGALCDEMLDRFNVPQESEKK